MKCWSVPVVALSLGLGCAAVDDEPEASGSESSESDASGSASSGSDSSTEGECVFNCDTDEPDTGGGDSEVNCGDGIDDDGDQQVDCDDTDCQSDEACGEGRIRIATWNTLRINPEGSAEFEALLAIIQRIDADVLCVQEVGEGEESSLQAVAEAAGYIDGVLAPFTGPPGAGLANACMSRTATADAAYLWADWISSDPGARDLTRPFNRLRVQVPGSGRFVSIVAAHLKAGEDDVDLFRRMVESIRLAQAGTAEKNEFPNNAVVVLGDLNYTSTPVNATFSSLPPGLPGFYQLGNDIQLPLTYDPARPLADAGLMKVDARFEDSPDNETFIPAGIVLDYIYVRDADVIASEVYEACSDDGVDTPPQGAGIEKTGDPLECGLNEVASDHRPVVVDLQL